MQDYREGIGRESRTVPSEAPTTPVPQVPLQSEQQVKISAAQQAEPISIDVGRGAEDSEPAEVQFDLGKIQRSALAFASNRNQGPASDYKTVKPTIAPVAVRFKQATRPQLLKPATQTSLTATCKSLRSSPRRPLAKVMRALPHQNHQTLPNPKPIALPGKRGICSQTVLVHMLRSASQAN